MSLQRYWASLKASFVGTIATLNPIKLSSSSNVNEIAVKKVTEEDVVSFVEGSKVPEKVKNGLEENTESSNGHAENTAEPSNGHSEVVESTSNGHAEVAEGSTTTNGHSKVSEEEPKLTKADDDSSSSSDDEDKNVLPIKEVDESSDEEVRLPNPDIERLITESKSCQKCKKIYETAVEASRCLNDHKRVRCYFCFFIAKNTETLFEHFRQSHQSGGRDRYLICPYCDQSVPYKSVSCHVISTHLSTKKMGTRSTRRSRPFPAADTPSPAKKPKQGDEILWVE